MAELRRRKSLPHFQEDGGVYFVSFHLSPGRSLIPEHRDIVLAACRYWHQTKIVLFAVVIMPDHVHLLFQLLEVEQLADLIHSIKSFSSHKIQELTRRAGGIWQRGYLDFGIWSEAKFVEKAQYIYNNPVKKKLVEAPEDYPWTWIGDL